MSRKSIISIMKILRTDTRQRILHAVASGSDTVHRLAHDLSLPTSTVRSNVTCLGDAGLLMRRCSGRETNYALGPQARFVRRGSNIVLVVASADGGRLELSRPAKWYRKPSIRMDRAKS